MLIVSGRMGPSLMWSLPEMVVVVAVDIENIGYVVGLVFDLDGKRVCTVLAVHDESAHVQQPSAVLVAAVIVVHTLSMF